MALSSRWRSDVKSWSSSTSTSKCMTKVRSLGRMTSRRNASASRLLHFQHAALAGTGVHQDAHGQRRVGFPRKIADDLRLLVFFQQVKSSLLRSGISRPFFCRTTA